MDAGKLFKKEYKNPIVEERELPAYLSGLRYFSVYDKSQAAEDPLIPSLWLVTPSNKKYRIPISAGQMIEILTEIAYRPSSELEALDATRHIAEWLFAFAPGGF